MWNKILRIWKIKDLRNNILFVLGMLVIFRAAAHVPIPGVDIEALRGFLESNEILGLLNVFITIVAILSILGVVLSFVGMTIAALTNIQGIVEIALLLFVLVEIFRKN